MIEKEELERLQKLSLDDKISLTQLRISEWYDYWLGHIFVSFSGGKDSTVLLDIARKCYPDIKAVYVDTRLEFPEVREFALSKDNITVLKPEMNFRDVIKTYGFVFPSKDVARTIRYYNMGSEWAKSRMDGKRIDSDEPSKYMQDRYGKWKFLLDAPFKISDMCCEIMKEKPLIEFVKCNRLYPIIGTMAVESSRRKQAYLKSGCNNYKSTRKRSAPISFWTEQDILTYIVENGIEIPSVYGKIVDTPKGYILTGEKRTGCMFCPIGAHIEKPFNKFQRMKIRHPERYKYCMEQLGLKELCEYANIPIE